MRIAIDARWIFPELSGVGTYTLELAYQLAEIDPHNEYLLYFSDSMVRDRTVAGLELGAVRNFTTKLLPFGVFSPWNQVMLGRELRRDKVDVFHSTNYMIPLPAFRRNRRGPVECVTTIHDVIPLLFPNHAPRSKKTRFSPLYRRIMKEIGARSDRIITVSQTSREDIIRCLRIPDKHAAKVRVVYNGVSPRFRPAGDTDRPTQETGRAKVMLYVGRADPYKNAAVLVRTLASLRRDHGLSVCLKIAGTPDPRYPEARELAAELGVSSSVEWLGYLSPEELVETYQAADVLVHPSRYEGFGLQILEAMACGLPVVCSNAGSLQEVAGDAALLVDPDDLEGFVSHIVGVFGDPELARGLVQKGFRQAQRFTWRKCAEETIQTYVETAGTER